ncbi:MAG: class II fructose-bisphosphate aldolase, partial [Saprospiraceae bacterium]|nr:class II fructose-bisphosphate aldolase [Saprospiraceae bacterium]
MKTKFRTGVLFGDEVTELLNDANKNQYAIPAVNVIGTNSVNACLETAKAVNSPIIIQFSNGGAAFYAGKGLDNADQKAAVLGAVSGALHIHQLAEAYGVTVVLHTDHCAKNLLPWMDGMLDANERHFEKNGHALFSSHMLDFSEEPIHENVEMCKDYLARMSE